MKRRQSLACSARSFSDIPAMKKSSADKTRLVSLGGRPETGAIRVSSIAEVNLVAIQAWSLQGHNSHFIEPAVLPLQ